MQIIRTGIESCEHEALKKSLSFKRLYRSETKRGRFPGPKRTHRPNIECLENELHLQTHVAGVLVGDWIAITRRKRIWFSVGVRTTVDHIAFGIQRCGLVVHQPHVIEVGHHAEIVPARIDSRCRCGKATGKRAVVKRQRSVLIEDVKDVSTEGQTHTFVRLAYLDLMSEAQVRLQEPRRTLALRDAVAHDVASGCILVEVHPVALPLDEHAARLAVNRRQTSALW